MKRIAVALLLTSLVQRSDLASRPYHSARLDSSTPLDHQSEIPPPASPLQNAAALEKAFDSAGSQTLQIPAGTFVLPCGSSFTARGSLSLIGAGEDKTIFRLERACPIERPLMSWISKSNVKLSDFTVDLNNSRSNSRQNILQFLAYDGNATGLQIDHIVIEHGNTLSLQIAVGAAGGSSYSGVVIDHNLLEMTPGVSQNECIALTTVNGSGRIPAARVTNNICRGSAIQTDGERTLVAGNDISGFQFGTGIFTAFVTRRAEPSSRACIIRDNFIHDTGQTLDVNHTAAGGIENNCLNSRVENNRAVNLGGAGFVNYASGVTYVGNRATAVGHRDNRGAGGEGDEAGFAVSDNGSGNAGYRSTNLTYEGNVSIPSAGRPRFGYYEEPWHLFNATLKGNGFRGAERSVVVRTASCRAAPVKC